MPSLTTNLVKRVQRLPKPTKTSEALLPLFEAISNSIHSTQKRFGDRVADLGRIEVTVVTGRKQAPVTITIEDNGIGLDNVNYEAFTTTDTDNKISIGGKGVGRLLWLDCFEKITVRSFYHDAESLKRRDFTFHLSLIDQIQNLVEDTPDPRPSDSGVFITFDGVRDNAYKTKFPGRPTFVFHHLVSHFLPTFIGRKSPKIIVHCGDDTKTYPDAIDDIIFRRKDINEIPTEEYGLLDLTLMECDKTASSGMVGSHFVHFIAHDRTVISQKVDGKLGLKYFGPDRDRVFHACVFGEYLNQNVNQERTNFIFDDEVLEKIVNNVCMVHMNDFLADPLREVEEAQGGIVDDITASYPSIAFGSTKELQKHLPAGEMSNDAIFGHLSRERFRRDQKQAEKIRSVLSRIKSGEIDENTFSSALADASKAIEEAEQKSLAEYIVRRKVVLDFIEILIEKVRDDTKDSSYQREDILHSFICPMQVNTVAAGISKIAPAASHDLWIIDERLTFAQYFGSDVSFAEMTASAIDVSERPDVLIFDKVHGLRQTAESSKVLLVEFKRPGRTSYANDENPQQQVERYVRRLQDGGQFDVRGRPIELKDGTIFHCFIVADIIGKMDEWTYSWSRTSDGRGRLYQPSHGFRGSIELMSWDSLLRDARERNSAFFSHAGISGKSFFSES